MNFSRWDINLHGALPPDELAGRDWHAVDDTEGHAGRLFVRVSKAADGRPVITGLHMSGSEITANTLRAIQPAAILRTLTWREDGGAPPRSVGEVSPMTGLARFEGVADEISAISEATDATQEQSQRGSRAPRREHLVRFAEVYRRHLQESPYNAMTLTARELLMHRATAHRWRDKCRELGLLDQKENDR
ncbi:hypothetical protein E3T35_03730 [Cryobacterium sp. TMT1-2-2]|uniref:hypothetical protein n=1 Tax=Cryobacterium sp. TMT1-2-2 TaxID=1259233 RepID=UPI00106BF541|nr:hypothetical protein [Cryobacterium sp. TMT1-2-2]TFD13855.1 hypothetical protein E3T35_03730 [Cryobacterium sp. TMT1-2-2]